jgi:hypothetical protein
LAELWIKYEVAAVNGTSEPVIKAIAKWFKFGSTVGTHAASCAPKIYLSPVE